MIRTIVRRNRSILWSLVITLSLSAAVRCQAETEEPVERTRLAVGTMAPSFQLATVEGHQIALEDFEGKVTAVVFWATWCGPCKPRLKQLGELYTKYRRDGFDVIAFNVDQSQEDCRAFLRDAKYPWRHNVWLGGIDHRVAAQYGVRALPTIYLLGRGTGIRANGMSPEMEEGILVGPTVEDMVRGLLFSRRGQRGRGSTGASVMGVVVHNGRPVEQLSASLFQLDGDSSGEQAKDLSSEPGCYSYHPLAPGRWLLTISQGRMSGEAPMLRLAKEINVLEDVQWHNFRLEDGTGTIACPANGAHTLAIRRWDDAQEIWVCHCQVREIWFEDGTHKKRNAFLFPRLQPGHYEYRLSWWRGDRAEVSAGEVRVGSGGMVTMSVAPPSGTCEITGKILNVDNQLAHPHVLVRRGTVGPVNYTDLYEIGTWDTAVRFVQLGTDGTFTCTNLSPGAYTITVIQHGRGNDTVPVIQESRRIQLNGENARVTVDLALGSRRG